MISAPVAGSTLYFEIVAQAAPVGTTNGTKSTNGMTDSIIALPHITVASSSDSTITASSLQSNMGSGSDANAGTPGGSSIDFRAIELGFTVNTDSPVTILSGTLTVGPGFGASANPGYGIGVAASTDMPVAVAGSMRNSGGLVAISNATESGANPLLAYTPLTVVPEPPGLCALFLLGAPAVLALRRRRI